MCGILEINQVAVEESGIGTVYTLVLDYLQTVVSIVQEQVPGENIKFDISTLNENFQYTGQIFDANGNHIDIISDEITYDCIKFKTVLSINAVSGIVLPPILNISDTVVIEDVIGEDYVITGSAEIVTGLIAGSNTITCNAFTGVRVIVIRGNTPIPGIDPGDGSNYFTKALGSDFITLNNILVDGEFIRIQTIPN